MKTIWKFPLKPSTTLQIPQGAVLLAVHEQHGGACLWAIVDPEQPQEARYFECYGTGHDVPDDPGKYVGTVFIGALVFHVFERSGNIAGKVAE